MIVKLRNEDKYDWFVSRSSLNPHLAYTEVFPDKGAWPRGCNVCMSLPERAGKPRAWVLMFAFQYKRDQYCSAYRGARRVTFDRVRKELRQRGLAQSS